jgi:hypothetical protein
MGVKMMKYGVKSEMGKRGVKSENVKSEKD